MLLCPVCDDYRSPSHADFRCHMSLFHENLSSYVLKCKQPECDNRNYFSMHGFMQHMKTHQVGVNINVVNEDINVVNDDVDDPGHNFEFINEIPAVDVIPPGDADNHAVNVDVNRDHADRLTLDYFIESHYSNVQFYIAQLYASPNVSRKAVHEMIKSTNDFISASVSILKENVFHVLSTCNGGEDFPNLCTKIDDMFRILSDPFDGMTSEYNRLSELAESGCFVKPEPYLMGHEDKFVKNNGVAELIRAPAYGQFVPLRSNLKYFFELPGMLTAIMNYKDKLVNDTSGRICNLIQGELWKELSANDEGKLVFPINLHFDDYEPDNALGSHHNSNSLGALYANLACLPPQFQSSTKNMFQVCTFKTNHRKHFGNQIAFARVVDELNYLEHNGIDVNTEAGNHRIFFRLVVVVADNAGCHAIHGFVEGFRANYYCRMCKMHRDELSYLCHEVPNEFLRTVENYNNDVLQNDVSLTGVKEVSVWNEVQSYHCISNGAVEIMHDYYLGVIKYDICKLLHYFISERNYFTVDILKDRINGFDYGPAEVCNKPPTCNLTAERLQNCSLNLSASEWLCLCRYLGEMLGDLIPENSRVWDLYLILNEIVGIVTSLVFEPGMDRYLNALVAEHHSVYVYYFVDLKPKHHFMWHYSEVFKRFGPVVHLSALTSETKHRFGKMYAKACFSRVNFPYSVAIKYQLELCNYFQKFNVLLPKLKMTRSKQVLVQSLSHFESFRVHFQPGPVCSAESVSIFGTTYKVGMVLVLRVGDLLPTFGQICHVIISDDGNPHFVVQVLKTSSMRAHVCAYIVESTDNFTVIKHADLINPMPLWQRTAILDGKKCVSMRNGL